MVFPLHVRVYETFKYYRHLQALCVTHEGCPENTRPFWMSWETVAWPLCNSVTSQRRPYCPSVNSHSLSRGANQSAVRCRWLSLCTVRPSHSQWPSEQIIFIMTMHLPILQLSCRNFLVKHYITQVCQPPYSPDLAPCDFWFFPKLKSPLKVGRFVNATVTQYKNSGNGVSLPTD